MQEKQGGFAKAQADKMTIQGQPGSSGADGWSLRWVSHNIKTPSQRPLLVPRTGALGGALYEFMAFLYKQNKYASYSCIT